MSKGLAVTGRELEIKSVTIDAPHGDILARAAAALAAWQAELDALGAELARLRERGVFLDTDGRPQVPTWWERADRASSHWLVWPAEYARAAGIPRRQRVGAGAYDATEVRRRNTLEYANVFDRHTRLAARIEVAGQDLARLADKYKW